MNMLLARLSMVAIPACSRIFAAAPDLGVIQRSHAICGLSPNLIAQWNDVNLPSLSSSPVTVFGPNCLKLGLAGGALIVVCGLCTLWAARTTEQLRVRFQSRLNENERVARDVNDSLLQSFQGVLLKFQAVAHQIQPLGSARNPIEDALDLADKVISDGRHRVMDLNARSEVSDVPQSLSAIGGRVLTQSRTRFRVIIEGTPRQLRTSVATEMLRIADEAVCNAARHARADDIEVSMAYRPRELTLCIRDNGIGVDARLLARRGRQSHCGLTTMRAQADRIHGLFAITSRLTVGTQIELSVSGAIAYADNAGQRSNRHRENIMFGL
jgi:signal transduction histidine kinase